MFTWGGFCIGESVVPGLLVAQQEICRQECAHADSNQPLNHISQFGLIKNARNQAHADDNQRDGSNAFDGSDVHDLKNLNTSANTDYKVRNNLSVFQI